MTPNEFVYWVKGYLAAQSDSQMKLDIEKALNEVQESKPSFSFGVPNSSTSVGYPPNSTFTYTNKQQLND